MVRHDAIDRRMFISQLGRRTLAVTLLGTGVVACSSSSDGETVTQTTLRATTTRDGSATTTTEQVETDAGDTTTTEPGEELRWSVAAFSNVSAYVLSRGNDVTIVDTGRGGVDPFVAALDALGTGWADVGDVVVTHLHGDHVGGLGEVLGTVPDAMAYAGTADVEAISSPRPLTGLNDGDEVAGLQIIGTPGHTAGHISVFDATSGVLVAGDALNTQEGAVLGANPSFTADMATATESVRRLAALGVTTVLPGHGPPVTDAGPLLADLAASV